MAESSSAAAAEEIAQDVQHSTEEQVAGPGEAPSNDQVEGDWCKVFCSKDLGGQEYYFYNKTLNESTWEEPSVPYKLWDYATNDYHISGLQQPTDKETLAKERFIREDENAPLKYDENDKKDPLNGWQGYNPRFHGPYDKNAPYVAYHNWLAYEEAAKQNPQAATGQNAQPSAYQNYDSVAHFNAHTGRYQSGDQSADRHDAASRAGRQMNAFFDVDSAANSHDGRSLKEERRNQKLSKKEIAEMNQKRKDKKHEKRMAFLKS